MAKELEVTVDQDSDPIIVTIAGKAGIAGAEELNYQLTRLLAKRPQTVIFDMSGLAFMASLAMGMVVSFVTTTNHRGGAVRLAACQPSIKQLFETAYLHKIVAFHDSVEDAKNA